MGLWCCLAHALFAIGAPAGFGAFFGVQAAGFRALGIHRAAARLGIQKVAVTTGTACHGEDVVLGVVVVDEAGLEQAFGNLLGVDVLSLKRVYQLQPYQICHLHFQRHGAAVGTTGVAHARFVFAPCFETVDVYDTNGSLHKQQPISVSQHPQPVQWGASLKIAAGA